MEIRRSRWLIFRSRVEGRFSFESLYYGPQLVVSRNAVGGKSGYTVETINDNKMLIFYEPVKFGPTAWVVLLMQPYNSTLELG
jgi:hypothetical protein